jgi:hypothetical protein
MSIESFPAVPAEVPEEHEARELWAQFLKIAVPHDLSGEEIAALLGVRLATARILLCGGVTRRSKSITLLKDAIERNRKARWRSDLRLPDQRSK